MRERFRIVNNLGLDNFLIAKLGQAEYSTVTWSYLLANQRIGLMSEMHAELAQLARLALKGSERDVTLFLRRLSRRLQKESPDTAKQIEEILAHSPTRGSPLRENGRVSPPSAVPVDIDSRMELARPEYPVAVDVEPIWSDSVARRLRQVILEREREHDLHNAGLAPTRSVLFTGPPGVGKSLAAKWIAASLDKPLLTLNLSAVMSSFLGRTGNNVRQVLEHAKSVDCILFLDELDSVAKRRDDEAEIGELKRLVTVLLQEIDAWPSSGLLLAATNHPDLLDPAVWRRFDLAVEFPMPTIEQVRQQVSRFLVPYHVGDEYIDIVVTALSGQSFSDIERELRRGQRDAVLSALPMQNVLKPLVRNAVSSMSRADRRSIAANLRKRCGMTEREVYEWSGVSRETTRKATKSNK